MLTIKVKRQGRNRWARQEVYDCDERKRSRLIPFIDTEYIVEELKLGLPGKRKKVELKRRFIVVRETAAVVFY